MSPTNAMKTRIVLVSIGYLILIPSCEKKAPELTTTTESGSPKVAPEPFKGSVYRSADDGTTLTLISADEVEFATNGTIHLCKYSKQDGRLRLVLNAFGTTQVIYFRETPTGLIGNDGSSLLSPEPYAAAKEQQRVARQREIELQQDVDRRQYAAAKARLDEETRIANLMEASTKASTTLGDFLVQQPGDFSKITLTDKGITVLVRGEDNTTIDCPFAYYYSNHSFGGDYEYTLIYHDPNPRLPTRLYTFHFPNNEMRSNFHNMYFAAFKKWAEKFLEVFQKYEHEEIP
jgi:hypothetical protein